MTALPVTGRPRFRVGQRVKRRLDVFAEESPYRHGTVTEKYANGFHYPILYAVRWDDGTWERGFLPHGLHLSDVGPVLCPYCGSPAVLQDSAVVYGGRSYGMIWWCAPCDAYVGTHKGSVVHAPLGRLANRELRQWKIQVHAVFDPLWKNGSMTRKQAYEHAARLMGLKEIHIGEFDVDQCKRLIGVLGMVAHVKGEMKD